MTTVPSHSLQLWWSVLRGHSWPTLKRPSQTCWTPYSLRAIGSGPLAMQKTPPSTLLSHIWRTRTRMLKCCLSTTVQHSTWSSQPVWLRSSPSSDWHLPSPAGFWISSQTDPRQSELVPRNQAQGWWAQGPPRAVCWVLFCTPYSPMTVPPPSATPPSSSLQMTQQSSDWPLVGWRQTIGRKWLSWCPGAT